MAERNDGGGGEESVFQMRSESRWRVNEMERDKKIDVVSEGCRAEGIC